MKKFDVIIIGGGPSGALCGIELQKKGIKTCIIDQSSFPRDKVCGGLLTQKSVDLIEKYLADLNPSEYIIDKTKVINFFYENQKITSFHTNQTFYYTERKAFDHILIKKYKELGGILFENRKINKEDIHLIDNSIQLDFEELKYKVLIGADGCNSVLARLNQLKRYDAFCIQGKQKHEHLEDKDIRIYFGIARYGYGWYFPKKDYASVGIIDDNATKSINKNAKPFFSKISDTKLNNIKGAKIPSGHLIKLKNLSNNTLLIGDAAGFTDPITGEGLFYAMLSGIYAAEAILENIDVNPDNVKNSYLKKIKPILRNIRYALFYQKILYNPKVLNIFLNYVTKHKSFALFYIEKVMSNYQFNYTNFLGSYLFHIKRHRGVNAKRK